MKRYLYLILLLPLFQSCGNSPRELGAKELIRWTEDMDNGLVASKKMASYEYRLQYRSVDYIIALESRNRALSPDEYTFRKKSLEGLEYYQLRIKTLGSNQDPLVYGISQERDYFERDYRFSYEFRQNITSVSCGDSSACVLYNFIQTRGLAPYIDIIFAFDKKEKNNCEREIRINDDILGTGNIVFTIDAENIRSTPTLTLAKN